MREVNNGGGGRVLRCMHRALSKALAGGLLLAACGAPAPPARAPTEDLRAGIAPDPPPPDEPREPPPEPEPPEPEPPTTTQPPVTCAAGMYRVERCVSPGMPRQRIDGTLDGSPRCAVECLPEPPTGSIGMPCAQTGPRSYSCHGVRS